MKTYCYETTTAVKPLALYRAITAISRWPEWDTELERIEHDGSLAIGAEFVLKPRAGPKVKMTIAEAESPTRFVDVAHLPLATMRTSHQFTEGPTGTRVQVSIEVRGVLGFLWDRLVARKQAAGAAAQTSRFMDFAQRYAR